MITVLIFYMVDNLILKI